MRHLHYTLLCACALLAGCSGNTAKEMLGLERSAPDEFRVLPRPALSVPPQFNLRPPATVAEEHGVGEVVPSQQAETLMMGDDGKPLTGKAAKMKTVAATGDRPATASESQFLKNLGATNADPQVRSSLRQEKIAAEPEEEKSWWDVFPDMNEKKEPTVSSKEEAERLKKNKAENKPVTTGETPASDSKDRGLLGRILGDW